MQDYSYALAYLLGFIASGALGSIGAAYVLKRDGYIQSFKKTYMVMSLLVGPSVSLIMFLFIEKSIVEIMLSLLVVYLGGAILIVPMGLGCWISLRIGMGRYYAEAIFGEASAKNCDTADKS